MYDTVEPWGYYAKCNKPVEKGQIHDSTYVKQLE